MTGKDETLKGLSWGDSPGAAASPADLPEDPQASYVPPQETAETFPLPPGAENRQELPTWATVVGGTADRAPSEEDESPSREYVSFKFVKRIGRGGCGEVWEAVQESLGRVIAVKRLRQDLYTDDEDETDFSKALQSEFRLEALTTARLEHPNIVPVHDFGQDELGQPLLAMKLVKGKPWSSLLTEDESLPVPEFLAKHLAILVDVAQAIAFAHSKAIIHRDLKPAQVMVGKFGEVVLMDWGLAVKTIDLADGPDESTAVPTSYVSSLQTARNPAGTPSYMAPEQTIDTAKELGNWTDIFLLGGILYRILTLTPPYNAATGEECFAMARLGDVTPPRKRAPDREIPRSLSNLAMACLQAHPQDRIASAREFIDGITDYLSGAGKRDEARKLIGQVEEMLESGGKQDYRVLSRAHHLLERARGLWPENRQIFELRDQVLQEYAREAIGTGDLVLARLQAEQVRRVEDRKPLLEQIEGLELRQRMHARQRKQLAVVLTVMLLSLTFLIWQHLDERKTKEAELAAQNQLLMQQRNTGWDMMQFMLNDLSEDLEASGRLDVLESMAEKSVGYFKSLPEDQLSGGVLRQQSLAWANLGDVRLDFGNFDGAVDAYNEAWVSARRLVNEQPQNGPYRSDLADRKLRLSAAYLGGGDMLRARDEAQGAIDLFRERLGDGADAELQRDVVRGLAMLGRVHLELGNPSSARKLFDEAEVMISHTPEADGEVSTRNEQADILSLRAALALAEGRSDQALADAAKTIVLREELLAEQPGDVARVRLAAEASRLSGRALLMEGDLVKAPMVFAQARDAARSLVERLPNDVRLRVDLAHAYEGIAEADWRIGRYEKAREGLDEAVRQINEALARHDSDLLHLHRLQIRTMMGETEWHAGQNDLALRLWEETLAEATSLDLGASRRIEQLQLITHLESRIAIVKALNRECVTARVMAERARQDLDTLLVENPELETMFLEPRLRSIAADALCSDDWQPLLNAIDRVPQESRTDDIMLLQTVAWARSGKTDVAGTLAESLRFRHADTPLLNSITGE